MVMNGGMAGFLRKSAWMQDVIDVIDVTGQTSSVHELSMCLKLGARSFGGPGYAERMSSVC